MKFKNRDQLLRNAIKPKVFILIIVLSIPCFILSCHFEGDAESGDIPKESTVHVEDREFVPPPYSPSPDYGNLPPPTIRDGILPETTSETSGVTSGSGSGVITGVGYGIGLDENPDYHPGGQAVTLPTEEEGDVWEQEQYEIAMVNWAKPLLAKWKCDTCKQCLNQDIRFLDRDRKKYTARFKSKCGCGYEHTLTVSTTK